MSGSEIQWGRRQRPRKADQGHSLRREGFLRTASRNAPYRLFIECECGKVVSAQALSITSAAVFYGWERHRREALKAQQPSAHEQLTGGH